MISNISKKLNIYNGKLGTLRGFVYAKDVYPPLLPEGKGSLEGAIIEFDELNEIPSELHFNGMKNHALITVETKHAESRPKHRRIQLPL